MIVAFSTSSPWTSVAAIEDGQVLWQGQIHAPQQSGSACMTMLEEMRKALGRGAESAEAFAADMGPGSFTGVRVGVMLAKTLAFSYGKLVMGADSFDLIDPSGIVVLPSKRGEFFVRRPGMPAVRTTDLPDEPYQGFGPGVEPSEPPNAAGFAWLASSLDRQDATAFVPHYLIEPSISVPKKPFAGPRGDSTVA